MPNSLTRETIGQTVLHLRDEPALQETLGGWVATPEVVQAMEQLMRWVGAVRSPDGGWPSDRPATPENLTPYVLDEAYDVLLALERSLSSQVQRPFQPLHALQDLLERRLLVGDAIPHLLWAIARSSPQTMKLLAGVPAETFQPGQTWSNGVLRLLVILELRTPNLHWVMDLATLEPPPPDLPTSTLVRWSDQSIHWIEGFLQELQTQVQQTTPLLKPLLQTPTAVEVLVPSQPWQTGFLQLHLQLAFSPSTLALPFVSPSPQLAQPTVLEALARSLDVPPSEGLPPSLPAPNLNPDLNPDPQRMPKAGDYEEDWSQVLPPVPQATQSLDGMDLFTLDSGSGDPEPIADRRAGDLFADFFAVDTPPGEPPKIAAIATSGASLTSAPPLDANIQDANIQDAKIQDANIRDANIQGANSTEATLGQATPNRTTSNRTPATDTPATDTPATETPAKGGNFRSTQAPPTGFPVPRSPSPTPPEEEDFLGWGSRDGVATLPTTAMNLFGEDSPRAATLGSPGETTTLAVATEADRPAPGLNLQELLMSPGEASPRSSWPTQDLFAPLDSSQPPLDPGLQTYPTAANFMQSAPPLATLGDKEAPLKLGDLFHDWFGGGDPEDTPPEEEFASAQDWGNLGEPVLGQELSPRPDPERNPERNSPMATAGAIETLQDPAGDRPRNLAVGSELTRLQDFPLDPSLPGEPAPQVLNPIPLQSDILEFFEGNPETREEVLLGDLWVELASLSPSLPQSYRIQSQLRQGGLDWASLSRRPLANQDSDTASPLLTKLVDLACQVLDSQNHPTTLVDVGFLPPKTSLENLALQLLWQLIYHSYPLTCLLSGVPAQILQPQWGWETGMIHLIPMLCLHSGDRRFQLDLTTGGPVQVENLLIAEDILLQTNTPEWPQVRDTVAQFQQQIRQQLQQLVPELQMLLEAMPVRFQTQGQSWQVGRLQLKLELSFRGQRL